MGFDDELLELAVKRRPALSALAAEPHHRRELQETLDLSKTTCHRIVRSFEDRGLLRRGEAGYELTPLGEVVHEQVEKFARTTRTATQLEPLVTAFASAPVEFDIELFADATITRPEPADPSPPVDRFLELFRDAERFRSLDRTSFAPPLYIEEMVETALQKEASGVAIFPRSVVEKRFAEYPEIHREAMQQGVPLRYRIYDTVPFGMTIYDDDHVGLRAYDDETGALLVFAETDDRDAVEWALDVFEYYHERSEPTTAFETFPDWV